MLNLQAQLESASATSSASSEIEYIDYWMARTQLSDCAVQILLVLVQEKYMVREFAIVCLLFLILKSQSKILILYIRKIRKAAD